MPQSDILTFPVYLLKRDVIEFDGKWFVIPEAVACDSAKDLALFIYRRKLSPVSSELTSPVSARNSPRISG